MICINKQQPLVMAIDWLAFTGLITYSTGENDRYLDLQVPEGYKMDLYKGTNLWQQRAILSDFYGRKVLTILWKPHVNEKTFLDKDLILFEVANYFLYQDLSKVIELTKEVHEYMFVNIARLDICVDFECTHRVNSILRQLWNHKCYVANKKDGSIFHSKDKGEEFPHQWSYGSKKSDYKWKLYNKSKELKVGTPKCEKTYIVENWEVLDMNINKVWRLEVSITKGKGFKYRNQFLTPEMLLRTEIVYEIFRELYNRRFIIRYNGHHTRKTNDKRKWLFELTDYRDSYERLTNDVESRRYEKHKEERPDDGVVATMLAICKVLESNQARIDRYTFDAAAATLDNYLARFKMSNYFEHLKGMCYDEYISELMIQNDKKKRFVE